MTDRTAEIAAPFMTYAEARDKALGLSVRCPVCNHGIGKFCLKDGVARHMTFRDIAVHPERVTLANCHAATLDFAIRIAEATIAAKKVPAWKKAQAVARLAELRR